MNKSLSFIYCAVLAALLVVLSGTAYAQSDIERINDGRWKIATPDDDEFIILAKYGEEDVFDWTEYAPEDDDLVVLAKYADYEIELATPTLSFIYTGEEQTLDASHLVITYDDGGVTRTVPSGYYSIVDDMLYINNNGGGEAKFLLSYTDNVNVGTATLTISSPDGATDEYEKELTFEITPAALDIIVLDGQSKQYGEPDPEYFDYTVEGLLLDDDKESVLTGALSRAEDENIGTYEITQGTLEVVGDNYEINSFSGSDFVITPRAVTVTADDLYKFYGNPDPTLTATFENLAPNDDESLISYSITREEGEDVDEYAISVTGEKEQGNYEVTFEEGIFEIKPFEIIATDDENADPNLTITLSQTTYTYDGTAKEPSVTITYKFSENKTVTIPSNEYQVSYKNNINVGTDAKAIITDIEGGNYTISGSKTFEIKTLTISPDDENLEISFTSNSDIIYNGEEQEPEVKVTYNGEEIPSTEYTVTYENNIEAGTDAKVIIKSNDDSNYSFDLSETFEIKPFEITLTDDDPNLQITLAPSTFIYDGNEKKPSVKIEYNTVEIPSTEYSVSYENNINVGTDAKVIITDIDGGNYTINGCKIFTISPATPTITLNGNGFTPTGLTKMPTVNYSGTPVDLTETLAEYQSYFDGKRDGYTFVGWSVNSAATAADQTINLTSTNDMTLYAVWMINQYTVYFYDADGTTELYPSITADFGAEITAPEKPKKEGFKFICWNPAVPETMPIGGKKCIAQWMDLDKISITFVSGTSEVDAPAPITGYVGDKITVAIQDLEWTGHKFLGWDKEIPTTIPAENMVITAQWETNKHSINYLVDGKEYKKIDDIEFGSEITTIDAPTKDGYTFSGWQNVPATMPDEDVTISGEFSVNQYTVYFYDADGTTELYPSITADFGAEITAPENPKKEGFKFICWNPEVPETMPIDGQKCIAQWMKLDKVSITFVSGTSEVDAPAPIIGYVGAKITVVIQDLEWTGHKFLGWDKIIPTTIPAENMVITAQWESNKHSIIYMVDNAEYKTIFGVEFGTTISTIDAPTKDGYTFSGWQNVPATMPDEDVTISGTFTINTYTVTFKNLDGNTLQTLTAVQYGQTPEYTGETPVKPSDEEGVEWVWIGWTPEIEPATKNATYVAKFTDSDIEKPIITSVTVNTFDATSTRIECIKSGVVEIKATDNKHIAKIEYTIDGNTSKYTAPFTLTESGEYDITVVATDEAGNTSQPIVAKAVIRNEATLTRHEYTYQQNTGEDVILEGLDLGGSDFHSIEIDGVKNDDLFIKPNALNHAVIDNIKVGVHTLHIYTTVNGEKHDPKIEAILYVKGYKVDIEQHNINIDGYCQRETADITLEFLNIECPKYYKIKGLQSSYQPIEDINITAYKHGELKFPIPDEMEQGDKILKVTFTDDPTQNTESDTAQFNIKISYTSSYIIKLFDDIIAIDNHEELFTSYEWYKDGKKIEGADLQYYQSDGNLTGKYGAFVTIDGGGREKICSIDMDESVPIDMPKHKAKAFPNPAHEGEEITIELINYEDYEYEDNIIKIVNSAGTVVATINNCFRTNTVTLPVGVYLGYVIQQSDNSKVTFKIVVE